MNWKQRVTALVVLILAVSLVGLTGTAQGQAVKNPDTLIYQGIGGPETLDPAQAYDTSSSGIFLWNIYETLIFFNGGRTDLYVPLLATEVPSVKNGGISTDARTYRFKIRSGVKFHDGTPMTPDDVKYSFMRFMLLDPDAGPAWILLASILGFDTSSTRDDNGKLRPDIWDRANRAVQVKGNEVVITLKEPYAPFLNIMASWSIVVSKKFVVANGGWDGSKATLAKYNNPPKPEDLTLFEKANGTGPFKLERWDHATETVAMVRNDNYWRAPAKLRRVVWQKVEEFGPRRLALQNGDADIIQVARQDQPGVTGMADVRIVDDLAQLANSPALFMNLNINTEGNPDIGSGKLDGNGIPANFFADVHVRRGFAYLFDRDRFVREAFRGKGRVANGPIPYGMLGYNPKGKWYEVSREKAAAEFREAHGGQVWANGFKFTVSYNTGNVARQTATQMIKEAVEALNPKFKVDIRAITWSAYLGVYRSRKLPMFLIGWVADYADPDNFTDPFMRSTGAFSGRQSYKNPEVDKLIQQAASETDVKKREAIYFKLQDIAFQDIPTIYLIYPTDFRVMRTWVKGWYHNPIFFAPAYFYGISKGGQ
jgi:peptide/nickel transport system substrate-binding protein